MDKGDTTSLPVPVKPDRAWTDHEAFGFNIDDELVSVVLHELDSLLLRHQGETTSRGVSGLLSAILNRRMTHDRLRSQSSLGSGQEFP